MSEAAATPTAAIEVAALPSGGVSIAAIAWRNLWRNRRRTWLMASAIGFAGLLVVAISSLQTGTFELLTDNTARFFAGHIQIQHPDYLDEPRADRTLANATARLRELEARHEFDGVAPRAQTFALVSGTGEPSDEERERGLGVDEPHAFGAMVVGVDPKREFAAIRNRPAAGRYIEASGEAYLGAVLAKNLGVDVGDEVAVVGNANDGGVAAMALAVVGTFNTGQAEVDRAQMHVLLSEFQQSFGFNDEVHAIALTVEDQSTAEPLAAALSDDGAVGIPWQTLLPEIHQMAELKYQSTYMIYALLLVLVLFSIVNAFIMTTFERTPEFGLLKALGMRPIGIMAMLSWEALWMAVLGLALTFAVSLPLVLTLSVTGFSLGDAYADMTAQYLMPERLYPAFGVRTAIEFSVAVLVLTQIAAAIPALRLRRLRVVDALRDQE